jgi:Carboxypeptidase regulatory-like domain
MRARLPVGSTLYAFALCALLGCGHDSQPPKPVAIHGQVVTEAGAPIEGARVTALDVNGSPISRTVATDAEGRYELDVSSARNQAVTLRAAAAGFEPFPSGIRRSLPIDLSTAVESGPIFLYSGSLAQVTLLPLADPSGLGSLSGTVIGTGALVVAEGPTVASTISGTSGQYVIFNLPPGTYTVRAYVAGWQFTPVQASVLADQETPGVDLAGSGIALGSVSGNVNIVNAPGGSATSVVLVVASTFNEVTLRGDVPPGLRAPRTGAPNVNGSFTISNVPDGTYKVLAAFENDGLVRDPDPNISGTQIVEVSVNGDAAVLPTSFKITEALGVVSPGADDPTPVVGTPTLIWDDDSSEDYYTVQVFDSIGNVIWENPDVPGVSGSPTVSVVYGGPALTPGRTYQFRATSWRSSGNGTPGPISSTEDLCGLMIAS